ncbi:hypothetical protein ACFOEK_06365 [Litoribrevibacter euphylliae]|uniref:DUF2802 domain-containing protein n=1 Tax=Litoribrevibacter euphylliae TaxID=1834034 RepID=A0ABV7HGH6_9GAMM
MDAVIFAFGTLCLLSAGWMLWRVWHSSNTLDQSLTQIELAHRQRVEELQVSLKRKELDIKGLTEAVDLSASSIEKIHRSIADTSFDLIETVKPVEKPAQVIRKAHNMTTKEVYGSIRRINRLVGDLSKLRTPDNKKKP